MLNNKKNFQREVRSSDTSRFSFSIRFFIAGLIVVALGFVSLSFVNRDASNLPGFVAPVLLVTGYIVVLISLLVKREK